MALQVVITLLALLLSSITLNYNGVYGGRISLSMEEDLQLETQLKRLNKPAVKSIKTEHGEIYDCVDFYKQPAFDNPLLKNHKPEMSSSISRETLKEASSGVDHLGLGLEGGGCPSGTVPIRRTKKEDLIRWKSFSKNSGNIHQFLNEGPGKHFAGYQMKDENLKYYGGLSYMSLHNPPVSPSQYSAAVTLVQGGQNQIQVGWHVVPQFYLDNKTHFFGYWTADASQKTTGCFNTICRGFVQVSRSIALGQSITKTSTDGDILELLLFLYKKTKLGNWWVAVGENKIDVGYWPRELFNSITESAPVVGWRGEVYAPQGKQGPEMGTGMMPDEENINPEDQDTAYFRQVQIFKQEDLIGIDPNEASLESIIDIPVCYSASDLPYINHFYKQTIFYGGSGKYC